MTLLIKNGTVVDPGKMTVKKNDVLIEDRVITKIGKNIEQEADQIIDATDCYVMPGFVDLHVHLRDPGFEYKETVDTGAKSAARGGFTTILAMPNTKPVADNEEIIKYIENKARDLAPIKVRQIGAITKGQKGRELADIEGMVKAGSPAISEDGKSVKDSSIYVVGLREAARCNIPVFAHCEDKELAAGGVMNSGETARKLNLPGIPNAAEDVIIARDIVLAKEAGARLHICHVATAMGIDLIDWAKRKGWQVSGEVCPHHFTLCDEDITEDNAAFKMNPPLRSRHDLEAVRKGIADDVIDVIATDHAPHSQEEKGGSMMGSAFGIVGLETAAALTYTELVKKDVITIEKMAAKMSLNPAKIIGLNRGKVQKGEIADLVVFNPNVEWTIDPKNFASKGKSTPFGGRKVYGRVINTIFSGKIVYEYAPQII